MQLAKRWAQLLLLIGGPDFQRAGRDALHNYLPLKKANDCRPVIKSTNEDSSVEISPSARASFRSYRESCLKVTGEGSSSGIKESNDVLSAAAS